MRHRGEVSPRFASASDAFSCSRVTVRLRGRPEGQGDHVAFYLAFSPLKKKKKTKGAKGMIGGTLYVGANESDVRRRRASAPSAWSEINAGTSAPVTEP